MIRNTITNTTDTPWRLINYRKVDDMIAAEFLHDLYNRHQPEINSLRFRNTLCFYHGNKFTSYAPVAEWETIEEILGNKFLNMDKTLFDEIYKYINRDKPHLTVLLEKLDNADLPSDGKTLASLICDLHYIALGEIYGVNLVQLETAISWAIRKYLEDWVRPEEIEEVVSKAIKSEKHTVSIKEQLLALSLSLEVTYGNLSLDDAINEYTKEFGNIQYAYGTVDTKVPELKISELCNMSRAAREEQIDVLTNIQNLDESDYLKLDSQGVGRLCSLAADIGVLRDNNKALMGKVSMHRNKLLNNVADITGIDRKDISRYLLVEIYHLLTMGKELPKDVLRNRWGRLVFQRQETLWNGVMAENLYDTVNNGQDIGVAKQNLIGHCASNGKIRGIAKHVRDREDTVQISSENILVAMGTDFDLMDGIQKCGGIITEEGGLLSHASVVARELRKPCIVGVQGVFSNIPDGAIVEMDATIGAIRVISNIKKNACCYPIIPLTKVNRPEEAGYKAYRLAQLYHDGHPILPGVVVPKAVCNSTISFELAQDILRMLTDLNIHPSQLIVRSSSVMEDLDNKSAAGIFESVKCDFNAHSLFYALKKVIDSANSIRSQSYFGNNKIPMSVLIQPYLVQEMGGVAFSRDPLTGDKCVIIEASMYGASSVVDGKPDMYHKVPWSEIDNTNKGEDLIQSVASKVRCLESIYHHPVDMEWGIEKNQLYIFQVRPITTINT